MAALPRGRDHSAPRARDVIHRSLALALADYGRTRVEGTGNLPAAAA